MFIRSVNRALDELSTQMDLATRISHITSTNETVSNTYLDEYAESRGLIKNPALFTE